MQIGLDVINKNWHWLVAVSSVILVLIAGVLIFTRTSAPAECQPRDDDPQGYLFKICTHLQANEIDVTPGDPTRYRIKHMEERTENNRTVVWVFLDCCYMGDIAIIDKASGEVIDFRVGPQ